MLRFAPRLNCTFTAYNSPIYRSVSFPIRTFALATQRSQQSNYNYNMSSGTFQSARSVIDIIKQDHRTIDQLYENFKITNEPESKLKAAQELMRAIAVHSNAEEMVVYPVIDKEVSKQMGDHSRNEHLEVEKLLSTIEGKSKVDDQFSSTLARVMQLIQHHVQEEENQLLPKLLTRHPLEDLERLGQQFQTSKNMAPTHPHPMAPKTGVSGMAAKVMSKPIDEARDFVAGVKSSAVENDNKQ